MAWGVRAWSGGGRGDVGRSCTRSSLLFLLSLPRAPACLALFEVVSAWQVTGGTPLYISCELDRRACATLLLERGADTEMANVRGPRPGDGWEGSTRRVLRWVRASYALVVRA